MKKILTNTERPTSSALQPSVTCGHRGIVLVSGAERKPMTFLMQAELFFFKVHMVTYVKRGVFPHDYNMSV